MYHVIHKIDVRLPSKLQHVRAPNFEKTVQVTTSAGVTQMRMPKWISALAFPACSDKKTCVVQMLVKKVTDFMATIFV
jgi:hypothetical protein